MHSDWQSEMLPRLRGLILQASPGSIEEEVKWEKPRFHEGDAVEEPALQSLVLEAMKLNEAPQPT
jgi:hypothetical protein